MNTTHIGDEAQDAVLGEAVIKVHLEAIRERIRELLAARGSGPLGVKIRLEIEINFEAKDESSWCATEQTWEGEI